MKQSNSIEVFLDLLKAGLWERDTHLKEYGSIDFSEVYRLSVIQSVAGLLTAGLEHVKDITIPQGDIYSFLGRTIQTEEVNTAMNNFIAVLSDFFTSPLKNGRV